MTSMNSSNSDDYYNELGQEFAKLSSLIPTIPKDQSLSELELIELVIAYIQQLQQLLSQDQWNDCLNKLSVSMKNSLLASSPPSSSSSSASNLINHILLGTNHRSPLATIDLDNTRLS